MPQASALNNVSIFVARILIIFMALFLIGCPNERANLSGKCKKEEEKQKLCRIKNFLICEMSDNKKITQKATGRNICTDFDGLFMIFAVCTKSHDCGGPAPRESSSDNR